MISKSFILISIFISLLQSSVCIAKNRHIYQMVNSLDELIPQSKYPITVEKGTLTLPMKQLEDRLNKGDFFGPIEPLSFKVNEGLNTIEKNEKIRDFASKFSMVGHEEDLYKSLQYEFNRNSIMKSDLQRVRIMPQWLPFLDKEKLRSKFTRTFYEIYLNLSELKKQEEVQEQLFQELQLFLSEEEKRRLFHKILIKESIPVSKFLLPHFAKKMAKKFTIYQGPNCFHAALAFQSIHLTNWSRFNVIRESGYHKAMINFDELWKVLSTYFYPVKLDKYGMKYGDIIVFLDVPIKEVKKNDTERSARISYRWIKHAATHLMNGYVFSKGSKSADSPYNIMPLRVEWQQWDRRTDNLNVIVFRRKFEELQRSSNIGLNSWIY